MAHGRIGASPKSPTLGAKQDVGSLAGALTIQGDVQDDLAIRCAVVSPRQQFRRPIDKVATRRGRSDVRTARQIRIRQLQGRPASVSRVSVLSLQPNARRRAPSSQARIPKLTRRRRKNGSPYTNSRPLTMRRGQILKLHRLTATNPHRSEACSNQP